MKLRIFTNALVIFVSVCVSVVILEGLMLQYNLYVSEWHFRSWVEFNKDISKHEYCSAQFTTRELILWTFCL
jgi:hypothetical protein